MTNTTRIRSINLGQLATPTDRMLMLGRLRKLEDVRHRPSVPLVDTERTVVVREIPRARRSFAPAAVLALIVGLASLAALGVGTAHATTPAVAATR